MREHKADGGVLTEADLASQAALVECLPGSSWHRTGRGNDRRGAGPRLARGHPTACGSSTPSTAPPTSPTAFPFFGVAVAYLVNHKTQIGVVHNPVTDEAFYAGRGAGAWLNDIPLPMRQPASRLKEAVAGVWTSNASATSSATSWRSARLLLPAQLRPSALEWCYVAAGRLDVYLHGGQMLWDYAAGRLILEEAGGSLQHPRRHTAHRRAGHQALGHRRRQPGPVRAVAHLAARHA